ncbi:MAG: hypothetical protein E7487_02035 [Ruminococcaceae bacterium]|nr:hypothetical protein [Oscillospiraceae bacterium]
MNIMNNRSVIKMYNRLSRLPLGAVTAKGWIKDQLLRSKDGMGGYLDELEPDMIANAFITYSAFDHLKDMENVDPTFAAGWSSEISGTYWAGLIQLAFTLNDEKLIEKATNWVNAVLKHQETDGYLGGYPENTDRMVDYNSWGSNWCYRALLSFYEATGREEILDAVHRGLLWFCENWKENKTDYAGSTIIESMVVVYAYTGDERLTEFCSDYLEWIEKNSRHQNKVSQLLSDKMPYCSMHTGAYLENVKHPAILYCATGEEKLLKASLNGMKKLIDKSLLPNGGIASNGEHLSPVSAVSEVEYCSFAMFNHSCVWLALASGIAEYGDEIERCIFNGTQGARKKDERAMAYFTSPNQIRATRSSAAYSTWVDNEAYAPCYNVACCPAQSVRSVPEYVRSLCLTDAEKNVYLFCYGPASVNAEKLAFEMDTKYPFREKVTLTVTKAEGAKLYLRIPVWCKDAVVLHNGKAAALVPAEGGFVLLDETLAAGDVIELSFPMKVSIKRLNDSDVSSKFPMVVTRGPLLYAIPVPERWEAYPGDPITPLPEGWSWYEVFPDIADNEFRHAPWGMAIDEKMSADAVTAEEIASDGYVWENPPVVLNVPLYLAPFSYLHCSIRTHEPYGSTLETEGEAVNIKMVPYGCTNLRISCLPRKK